MSSHSKAFLGFKKIYSKTCLVVALIKRVGPTAITDVFRREYVQYTVFVTRTHIKANIDTALGRTGRQTRSRRDIRAVRLLLHSTAVCAFFGLW